MMGTCLMVMVVVHLAWSSSAGFARLVGNELVLIENH